MASGRRALLDDEDDDGEETEKPQLGYNEKYAQRFEHNKKREDLHRLQELQKKGLDGGVSDDDESSASEEDEDGLLPTRTEEKIFETLAKIKVRDPSIYSSDTRFFEDDDEDEQEETDGREAGGIAKLKIQKPMYLKDVNARQLLEGGVEEDEEEVKVSKKPPPGYLSEQDELKRAFLQGVREAEGEEEAAEDLLRVKKKTKEELERDARDSEEAIEEAEQRAKDKGIAKRLEDYFGKDDDLDDDNKFLKEYLLNKGWIDHDQKPRYPTYDNDEEDISEDEDALDRQDQYEKDYNFRFQEGVDNTYVRGHSRVIDDSVRKKSETRKKQREKKKERESEEERGRREELKRLKNVKKKEVLEKLSKIRSVAGVNVAGAGGADVLGEEDLDEDFDPAEYDKKMMAAFGEEYYGADDPDFVDGDEDEDLAELEKPDFDAEDELLGLASDGADSSAGFAALKAKLDLSSAKPEKKKKLKVPFEEKLLIDKHLEEYYKLDYEDVIGDLPTRFKYRPVKPNKYGLKTKDIIGLDDKELNQFVSLKKLAPYTADEWEPRRPAPRLSSKGRKKKALNSVDPPKKKKKVAEEDVIDNNNKAVESRPIADKSSEEHYHAGNGDGAAEEGKDGRGGVGSEKKKKNRKRKKAGATSPLPMSRLLSYAPLSTKRKVEGTPKMKKVKRRHSS